jgi:hypothetical protein
MMTQPFLPNIPNARWALQLIELDLLTKMRYIYVVCEVVRRIRGAALECRTVLQSSRELALTLPLSSS